MKRLVIGGCAKNVGRYLPQIFYNIDLLREWFSDVKVIFAYDKSFDDTLVKLRYYQYKHQESVIVIPCTNDHRIRTVNIASARNTIMGYINKHYPEHELLCFLDCDDIINGAFKRETFDHMISIWGKWDALSFNRKRYYDIWALRYDPYLASCWAFGEYSRSHVVQHIQCDITTQLNGMDAEDVLPVQSAFNGIGFFKLSAFKDARFDGMYHHDINFVNPFNYEFKPSNDDCEWPNFYESARKKHSDLRVVISPMCPY